MQTGKIDLVLEMLTKTGEIFTQNKHKLNTVSNRPRVIFNPSAGVKAVGGFINYCLIKAAKDTYPEIVHGVDLA